MSNVVKLDFNFDLKNKLATLPERLLRVSREEAERIMQEAKQTAQLTCPIATGSLRQSIRLEQGLESETGFTMRLRAGGYVTNPRTGHLVNYAKFVEARFGFMRAAAQQTRMQTYNAIQRVTVEEANR